MPIKKGDFILVDYVAKVSETGEIFDTTNEDVAKEEGIYKDGGIYEPNLVAVGEGWVLKALDEAFLSLKPNKTEKIEISPEKAFGKRDPAKIKRYPLRKLTSKGITPQIGMRVEVDGKLATIRTMGSGRILLDFNPPLAGKTLIYEVNIRKKLRTVKEKIKALLHRRIPQVNVDKFSLDIKKRTLEIGIPEEAFYIEGLQISKRGMYIDVQKYLPRMANITFIETFKVPKPIEEKPSSGDRIDNKKDS